MSFTSSSIFGTGGLNSLGATAQPSQPPQQSSIFSSNDPTSIFANQSTTQAAPSTSLFGGQSQAQQQPAQSSILGTGQPNASTAQPLNTTSQAAQPAFFNSLLERGKKRPLSENTQNTNFEELPNLQLGLDDIRRKARGLGTGSGKGTPTSSSKA